METRLPVFELSGDVVTVGSAASRHVNTGKFRLENRESRAVRAAVNVAWAEFCGGQQVLASNPTLRDLTQDQPLDPESFTISPGTTLPFAISFAEMAYEPSLGECTAVGLRLYVEGTLLEALSPIEFLPG